MTESAIHANMIFIWTQKRQNARNAQFMNFTTQPSDSAFPVQKVNISVKQTKYVRSVRWENIWTKKNISVNLALKTVSTTKSQKNVKNVKIKLGNFSVL